MTADGVWLEGVVRENALRKQLVEAARNVKLLWKQT